MHGRLAVVTGGTAGIGLQIARSLALLGASLVLVGRSEEHGRAAVDLLGRETGDTSVAFLRADLSTKVGIQSVVDEIVRRNERVDILVNNAGYVGRRRAVSDDGIEMNLAVNVMAPFMLTRGLTELLGRSTRARVVNVTGGSLKGHIDLQDLQAQKAYIGLEAYSHSKLVMMAMSRGLANLLRVETVTVNVCFPGQAATAMTQSVTRDMLPLWMRPVWPAFRRSTAPDGGKSAKKAARSAVFLASSPELDSTTDAFFDQESKRTSWPRAVATHRQCSAVFNAVESLADE